MLEKGCRVQSSQVGAFWILASYFLLKVHGDNIEKGELFDENGDLYCSKHFVKKLLCG